MRRLVLVGGGHAHLHVLRSFADHQEPDVEIVLISPSGHHHYSGMVPGYLQGTYCERQLAIDLPHLCRSAGARFVQASARCVDPAERAVEVDGTLIAFDIASLDVGSEAAALDVPGVRDHAYLLRPMSRAVALRERVAELIRSARAGGSSISVSIVGGGAAGIEVSLALHRRIRSAGADTRITIFEAGPLFLPDYPAWVRQTVQRILDRRGISVRARRGVAAVSADEVRLDTGETASSDLTVWLTGSAPAAVLASSTIPRDADGYFLVDDTLRATDGSPVWGAGDCVTLVNHPRTPKAGVYAVREGPVLAANLRAELLGGRMRRYKPQRYWLSLLNTADGKALLRWDGVVSHSPWAWWLKDWIDRKFVRTYQQIV